jgi:hypothetical protein
MERVGDLWPGGSVHLEGRGGGESMVPVLRGCCAYSCSAVNDHRLGGQPTEESRACAARRPPRRKGAARSRPGAGDCSSTRTMSAPPLSARGAPRRSWSGSSSLLRRDVMCPAVRPEGSRETGIAGDLRWARRRRSRSIDGRDPPDVVTHRGDHHDDRDQQPEGVDAKGRRPETVFPASSPLSAR